MKTNLPPPPTVPQGLHVDGRGHSNDTKSSYLVIAGVLDYNYKDNEYLFVNVKK